MMSSYGGSINDGDRELASKKSMSPVTIFLIVWGVMFVVNIGMAVVCNNTQSTRILGVFWGLVFGPIYTIYILFACYFKRTGK